MKRNINGNTKVKKAAAGFLQKALFSKRNCLSAIVTGFMAPSPDG
jgi:hypothetical protein